MSNYNFDHIQGDRDTKGNAANKSNPKDINRDEVSLGKEKRHKSGIRKIISFIIIILLLVFAYYIVCSQITNIYVSYIDKEEITNANILRDKYYPLPFMKDILNSKIESEVEKIISLYNQDVIDEESAKEKISNYEFEDNKEYIQTKISQFLRLKESKEKYKKGVKELNNSNYITATQYFSEVIMEDNNYSDARKNISLIAEDFKKTVLELMYNAVNDGDYNSAIEIADIGGRYSSDKELSDMRTAAKDCGNPLIISIQNVILDNLNKIEIDEGNKKQKCKKIFLIQINDLAYLLKSEFGTKTSNYSSKLFYIDVEKISYIEREEFIRMKDEAGETKLLEIAWDSDAKFESKREALYSQLVKLGPTYNGDLTGVSIIGRDSSEASSKQSSNKYSIPNLFKMILVQYIALFICGWIIIGFIKSLFS